MAVRVSKSLIAAFENHRSVPQPDTARRMDEFFGSGEQVREASAEAAEERRAKREQQPLWFMPVPVHIKGPAQSRVLGEYGVDAYIVTYDVQDYWILDFKKCNVNGSPVRETRNAPTIVETWRFRLI